LGVQTPRWAPNRSSPGVSKAPLAPMVSAMGKFGWTAIGVIAAALVADQYWNYGYYTDSALAVLRDIKRSFGW